MNAPDPATRLTKPLTQQFTMTAAEWEDMMKACQPVPYMIIGGIEPRSPQQNANDAWRALGHKRGFKWETVRPSGRDQHSFMAELL